MLRLSLVVGVWLTTISAVLAADPKLPKELALVPVDGLGFFSFNLDQSREHPGLKKFYSEWDQTSVLKALPKLGGNLKKGHFQVLFCDGSVRVMKSDTPEAKLKAFITTDGGEPVRQDE
jgi:prepilin-type processing-associated H-X9-DG protein